MRVADAVLYVVADPIAEAVIRTLNANGAMSLRGYYGEGVNRRHSYEAMMEHMLSYVRAGQRTCAVLYGHPGVFAYPAHEAAGGRAPKGTQPRCCRASRRRTVCLRILGWTLPLLAVKHSGRRTSW